MVGKNKHDRTVHVDVKCLHPRAFMAWPSNSVHACPTMTSQSRFVSQADTEETGELFPETFDLPCDVPGL